MKWIFIAAAALWATQSQAAVVYDRSVPGEGSWSVSSMIGAPIPLPVGKSKIEIEIFNIDLLNLYVGYSFDLDYFWYQIPPGELVGNDDSGDVLCGSYPSFCSTPTRSTRPTGTIYTTYFDWRGPYNDCANPPLDGSTCAITYRRFDLFYDGDIPEGSGSVSWRVTITPVPEPASWLMMVSGFGVIGLTYRQRQRIASLAS